jgi:serine/threonine-protein kinase
VAAAVLTHPCIVGVYDTGTDGGVCYIVLEYVPGASLREVLNRGIPEPGRTVEVMVSVLSALGAAHDAGVIHRDVKPANIMVSEDGRVKVTDFGIARAAFHGDNLTSTGAVLGTVRYLSPEQVDGGNVDPRSDLYSTGVVLYEALTGRPPFSAETDVATALMRLTVDPPRARDIRPAIPRELEAVVLRAMARRPDDRFQSAQSMRLALERALGGERTRPRGIRPVGLERPARTSSTFRSWMLAPLVLVLLAAAAIAGGLALGRLEFGGPLGVRPAPATSGDAAPGGASGVLSISSAQDFDPQGNDHAENPDQVPFAIDGSAQTAWSTDHYNTAEFGGLKQGLGIWLSLARESSVDAVTITSPLEGWRFEVRAGASPEAADPIQSATSGDSAFTARGSGPTTVRLTPSRVSGILIWITRLAPDGGRFAASISGITVAGST